MLKLSSGTLLRVLRHYGNPKASAADPEAAKRLARWGPAFLSPAKIERLLAGASSSVGVRVGEWERRQIGDYAELARASRREVARAERHLRHLAVGHTVLQAQGKVVGVPTACVLWMSTGDPRKYHAAGAFRKAMGFNLVEQRHLPRAAADQQAGECGRGIGSISRRCGWSSIAAYVRGTRPRRPEKKTMPGGSWWP